MAENGPEIRQIPLQKMALFAYIIGDPVTGTCALVDPASEVDRILATVAEMGYRVTHLINTHGHGDHVCGNREVIKKTGAKLWIHRADAPLLRHFVNRMFSRIAGGRPSPAPDVLVEDGDTIGVGAVSLSVLHTPGHTRGGICLYTPGHVFTGDTLFTGAVGATFLPGTSHETLIRGIRERLFPLPDDTIVWPGHDYGKTPFSTILKEKTENPFLRVSP